MDLTLINLFKHNTIATLCYSAHVVRNFVLNHLLGIATNRKKLENLSQKFPIWAYFLSFCLNDCSKVRRLTLATKMKILSWKFVCSLLLGIAKNNLLSFWRIFSQKSFKKLLELSCSSLRSPCLTAKHMIRRADEGLRTKMYLAISGADGQTKVP